MPTTEKGNDRIAMRARSSPIGGEWILAFVMMACVILPVAWLWVGWSRDGVNVTMESMGAAVYAMYAAIWLPLAWLRLRRGEWLWFSSHMLMFVSGLGLLAGHLLPSGPRFQLALLALASATSALTLMMLELIAFLKRRLGEHSDRIEPDSTEPPDPRTTWSWARSRGSRWS